MVSGPFYIQLPSVSLFLIQMPESSGFLNIRQHFRYEIMIEFMMRL
jgi:hypothetical protein